MKPRRMDLWADNLNFAARVEVQVYDPLTDEDIGKLVLEAVDGKVVVTAENVQVTLKEGAVT